MNKVLGFIKKEIVFCVAGVLAIATAFVVHPSKAYLGYIDFKVLALLLSLMLVVAGLRSFGIFTKIIETLSSRIKSTRVLELLLVFICFFSSMVITNDVALITFVPFTIEMLNAIGKKNHMVYIIVLQTIAANLGSMVTPIGNPQNIFLYTRYEMGMGDFFSTMIWYAVAAMILLAVMVIILPDDKVVTDRKESIRPKYKEWKLIVLFIVFLLCIACVLRVLDYRIMFFATVVFIILVDYRLLKKADYMLLLTFVAFFILTGNIKSMESVSSKLANLVVGRELAVSVLLSQVISNVPSAVLLANFTENGKMLLTGVNIGGLGTLIASMASLISFRFYGETKGARKGKYIGIFTGINLLFLGVMLIIAWITG